MSMITAIFFFLNIVQAQTFESLTVPSGYKIKLDAKRPGARSMALAPDGTLFVSTGAFSNPLEKIYRIKDWNKDGAIQDDEVETLIDDLDDPNGVAIRNNDLYVGLVDEILVFKDA